MNTREKYSLVPTLFDEGFFPSFLRRMSLFDDESLEPLISHERSNISLSEDENKVYIEANVPGVPEKNIELTQDKGVLWIKGEAKEEEKDTKRKFYHKATRSFSYRVAVPGDIDEAKEPKAEYKNGVIKITYMKKEVATPRKIQITSNS